MYTVPIRVHNQNEGGGGRNGSKEPNIQPPDGWNIPQNDLWHLSPTFASGPHTF